MHTKLPVIIFLLGMSLCGFAQERGFRAHVTIKPKTDPPKPANYPQSLAELFASVEKATTPMQKAMQYFLISRNYANMLNIDSALYFAEKIKELSSGEMIQAISSFSRS